MPQAIFAHDDQRVYLLTGPLYSGSISSSSSGGSSSDDDEELLPAQFLVRVTAYAANGTLMWTVAVPVNATALQPDDSIPVCSVPASMPGLPSAYYVELQIEAATPPQASIHNVPLFGATGPLRVGSLPLVLDRAVYWLSALTDVLDWDKSNFYTTPVTEYANFAPLVDSACALGDLEWTAEVCRRDCTVSASLMRCHPCARG